MLEIRSGSEEVLFSDSVKLSANTGPYDDAELDVQISDAQQYTFEATSADGKSLSETFTAKCGPVFVSITEAGELKLRDDELDHLRDS